MDLPELGTPGEETVKKAKTLCPWLPDPMSCPECGVYTDAEVTYDPMMGEYMDSWVCPECGKAFYRESY